MSLSAFCFRVLNLDMSDFHQELCETVENNRMSVIMAPRQHGKCLEVGTSVMMFNGTTKNVEDVIVGDQLMGDDSTPRNVLSTVTGEDDLYEVIPTQKHADAYTVNSSHILSLMRRQGKTDWRIEDINIQDYLKLTKWQKEECYFGYQVPIAFEFEPVKYDPYLIGLWLGDGNSRDTGITNIDFEIIDYLKDFSKKENFKLSVRKYENRVPTYALTTKIGQPNPLLQYLIDLNLIKNKHIPKLILTNSVDVRLELLAGLIDSDGYKPKIKQNENTCEVTFCNKRLAEDTLFLFRSLGFRSRIYKKPKVNAYRVFAYGDFTRIPTKVKRKQWKECSLKNIPLKCGIKIRFKGKGKYAGFVLDGNKRFLLGDFTVTHNTEVGTIAHALWRAYYGKDGELILMVSSVADQASAIMDRFRHYIETNAVLKEQLMPENTYKEKWGSTIVSCRNGVTVRSSGLSSKIRGLPVNYLMLDDVLRDDVGSTGKTKKLFFEVVLPTISATKGTLSVVGTPQSFIDLLHELTDAKGNGFAKKKFSAVILDSCGEWNKALWPQKYDLDELDKVRNTVGSVAWSKEYMCNPVSGGSSLFPYALIEKSIRKSMGEHSVIKETSQYYLGCDIALSSKSGADFSVFTVGEREKEGAPLKVVKILRFKGKPLDKQAAIVNDLNDRYNFAKIYVEQAGLGYDFPNKLVDNYSNLSSSVVPFKTTRKEKERILGGLEISFRNGALLLPNNEVLIEELLAFGVKLREDGHGGFTQSYEALSGHDDCVMSLAILVDAATSNFTAHTIEMV